MGFTKSQTLCIETDGRDMIVSAGAGSGKTTVLTERIMRKIEEGEDINRFLVVTFTNAAAEDLRAKLAKKISDLAQKDKKYQRMLYTLSQADICTIDSFCLQYVKQNAAALGIAGGCSVGDTTLCDALLSAAADEALTELCETDEPTADILLNNFAGHKNDDKLIETATQMYTKLRAYPSYLSWLDERIDEHNADERTLAEGDFFSCVKGAILKSRLIKKVSDTNEYIDALYSLAENEKQIKYAESLARLVDDIKTSVKDSYDAFCKASFKIDNLPKGCSDEYKNAQRGLKAVIEELAGYKREKQALSEEYRIEGQVLTALGVYIKLIDALYSAAKRERGILDFADAEHFMLKLLSEETDGQDGRSDFCKSLSRQYKEVFIDEYQDVSPLQDAIFKKIGEGKRFMVGDVKQSIYAFRNAYPDIFNRYRESFAPVEENEKTACIYLKENFRSDKKVIDFCNCIFDKVFTVESAGTDYKRERLIFGKAQSGTAPVQLTVLENAKIDIETEYVAEQVANLIQNEGFKPKEIALLSRTVKSLSLMAEALEKRGVPHHASKSKLPLLKQPEVLLALSLLRVVDNPTDDISLAATLRSPMFRFTAQDLVAIRRSSCLYDDVCYATKSSGFAGKHFRCRMAEIAPRHKDGRPLLIKTAPAPLAEKCVHFTEKLKIYRTKALIMPVDEFLWYLYEDTHIMLYAPKDGERQYKDNLFALIDLAKSFEKGVYKGVSAFMEHIERLERANSSPDAPMTASDNAVDLMTVHGSKGLQYRAVFVFGCGKRINFDNKNPININYNNGISAKLVDQKRAWKKKSLLQELAQKAGKERELAEEYRMLYVAFTRAEERLYISTAMNRSIEKYLEKGSKSPSTYADMFLPTALETEDESFEVTSFDAAQQSVEVTRLAPAAEEDKREDAALPSMPADTAPPKRVTAKYAVSELTLLENGLFGVQPAARLSDKRPKFADGAAASGAKRGTANHLLLQFANHKNAEKDIAEEAKRLLAEGFINDEQYSLLDIKALGRFFTTPLYEKIKSSPRVYREKRFTTRLDAAQFGAPGENVLLQGVIDCFFENESGGYTLVDYKTDFVPAGNAEALVQKYRVQLELYAQYIEKTTNKPVTDMYIYSLALNRALPVEK